jgi:hypothetical protein
MNTSSAKFKLAPRRGASVIFALSLLAAASAQAAFNSGSTGADGALNPTVNTEIVLPASGVLNYTSINIPAGVTVTFKKNATNTPVYLLASGNVTIAGTIDVRGQDAKSTGTYGDGALGDDGIPGIGGPGGFDGGRGGRDDAAQRAEIVRGGGGLGPGGGIGGLEGGNGCVNDGTSYFKYEASGGAYADNTWGYYLSGYCDGNYRTNYKPAAKAYGSALLQPLIGGSGGGGGRGGTTYPGSGGGGGGGAILVAANGTLSITGTIDSTGGDAGGLSGTGAGGYGAGGAGGAIRLVATSINGNGRLYAAGGCLNYNNARRQYCGITGNSNSRGGASGRIRLEAEAITFSGTAEPAYAKDVPGPVFLAEAPSLRIASVAGRAVPENPTGNADITLPADTTTAVEITFQTRNVPIGNTVLLRVVPAYGVAAEAITPAIAGTTSAGTAAVSVTLPSGPSTLQATTTYTVVVAGQLDLSRFAQNEPVEKVEVTVSLQGETRTRVLTASGKSYDVPFRTLQAAGFRG